MGVEGSVRLESTLLEVLSGELAALLEGLREPSLRGRYEGLLEAVRLGELSPPELEVLGDFLALVLGTGRVRRLHGPAVEQALQRLFVQTPRGRASLEAVTEVNRALEALRGHPIEALRLRFRPPHGYALTLATPGRELVLHLDAEAATVHAVAVDL